MAGTGDLLDAVREACGQRGTRIRELHAIEIHAESAELCRRRLRIDADQHNYRCHVARADAFVAGTYDHALSPPYDLVIANPPYVRYQAMNGRGKRIREGLAGIVARAPDSPSGDVWAALAAGYSGLADLSVPSWLLCALLVRPGGRLALVSPSTWRTRAYSDVVRYLMLRAFEIEFVVEDSRPGWFPDAVVGTHLVVARRLSEKLTSVPLADRTGWPSALWTKVQLKPPRPHHLWAVFSRTDARKLHSRPGAGTANPNLRRAAFPVGISLSWASGTHFAAGRGRRLGFPPSNLVATRRSRRVSAGRPGQNTGKHRHPFPTA